MRPPKTHALHSPWGLLRGTAKEITQQYNTHMLHRGSAHATITLSQVRRLLRGELSRPVNGSIFLRDKTFSCF